MTRFGVAVLLTGMLTLAGCGDPGATMSGPERQEMTDEMTAINPMATGEIPAADGNNMMQ